MSEYVLITNSDDFIDMCQYVKNEDVLYLDTETSGLDPYTAELLLMSLRAASTTFVVDFRRVNPLMLEWMKETLEQKKVVIHNATFDWKIIFHNSGVNMQNMHCCLVAEQVLTAGIRGDDVSLEGVALRRCNKQLNKAVRDIFIHYNGHIPTEAFEYAADDALVLEEIYKQQMYEFHEKNLMRVYDIEMPLLPVTARMEYHGINFNRTKMEEAQPVFRGALRKAAVSIHDELIEKGIVTRIIFTKDDYKTINISSDEQVLKILNAIGVDVKASNKKELGSWDNKWAIKNNRTSSVDEDNDDDFNIGYAHPFLRKLAVYKGLRKINSDYGEGLYGKINPVTGRVHCSFWQCGASATGRYSSSSPNLQNIIRSDGMKALGLSEYDIRPMFIPSPGRKMVIADLSGIEAVILGALSKDENLLTYLKGDIHTYVASNVFKQDVDKGAAKNKIDPHYTMRQIAKSITYAIMYGTSGWNLYKTFSVPLAAIGIHITVEDGDEWIRIWKALFPKAGRVLDDNARYAVTRNYVTTVTGRRRNWNPLYLNTVGRINAAMREGSNSAIQGSSADILKQSLILLDQRMDHERATILLCVHDEIVSDADEEYAEEMKDLKEQCFSDAGFILFPDLPRGYIRGEGHISDCYDK